MRALLNWIEPKLPAAEEEAYRIHFLAPDRARAVASFAIVLVLMLGVFVLEISYLGAAEIVPVATIRVLFFAFSFGIFVMTRGPATPQSLDRAALVWSIGFAAQLIALMYVRPASRIDDVGMMVVTLAVYAFSPASLARRVVPAFLVCVGYIVVLATARDMPLASLWPTIFIFVAINALGIVASARLETQRRRQFHSQEELRRSILERDALIDRLRQSHKMESMGRIVGGVAHDFNNILGTMLASVEFLLDELPANSTSRADAETIRGSVKRGAELTQQLLAFSRQQVLEPKVVSLNELVADTQRMLMRTIGEDVAIRVSLGEHLSAVRVDPGQVQQILLNLSVNARDAMPSGGTLAIHTRNMTLTESAAMSHSIAEPGQYVVLTVSDDGTGMGAATLAQIFEPFFTTKPKGRGTGLGLSTVFGIVEQSGGHIRVASTLGHGTTFEIFLPAVNERPSPIEEPREAPLPRGHETILLAEDDEALRTLTARILTAQGYRVLEASDGVEALRVAETHTGTLDLLTTDMVMPSMGGHDLANELSARRPGLKVLFVSGYTDDAVGRGELQPGDAFLQKPVDPRMLARKVRQLLDGSLVGG
ncbi:MAG TPA: ATP-binding protein [Gemmatimonadaceae bacterium]|nr:ATP-binding protein [Gemmatimonadaceae bacterium]